VLGGEHLGIDSSPVNDARHHTLAAQAAARTFALIATGHGIDFKILLHVSILSLLKTPSGARDQA
jgi:hypothetical protein